MGYLEIVGAGVIWACTTVLRLIQKEGFTSWDIVLARSPHIDLPPWTVYPPFHDREEEAAAQCMRVQFALQYR